MLTNRICDFQTHNNVCRNEAPYDGLLQVMNPTTDYPEGLQVTVKVCDYHSFRWSMLWGTWPADKGEAREDTEVVTAGVDVTETVHEVGTTYCAGGCGTVLQQGDRDVVPCCVTCIIGIATKRRANDRRTLTRAQGRTW